MGSLKALLDDVRRCDRCRKDLPLGPRPVIQVHASARLLIIGQAPGKKVHLSGIPWDDASGDRLRDWLGISKDVFYDERKVAIVPIGFCYPGTGTSGDLPPRKECFESWHQPILAQLKKVRLIILAGKYAQEAYLKGRLKHSLTETVKAWEEYFPQYIPLPHPSPLNNIWLSKNRWFEKEVIPRLREAVRAAFK